MLRFFINILLKFSMISFLKTYFVQLARITASSYSEKLQIFPFSCPLPLHLGARLPAPHAAALTDGHIAQPTERLHLTKSLSSNKSRQIETTAQGKFCWTLSSSSSTVGSNPCSMVQHPALVPAQPFVELCCKLDQIQASLLFY